MGMHRDAMGLNRLVAYDLLAPALSSNEGGAAANQSSRGKGDR